MLLEGNGSDGARETGEAGGDGWEGVQDESDTAGATNRPDGLGGFEGRSVVDAGPSGLGPTGPPDWEMRRPDDRRAAPEPCWSPESELSATSRIREEDAAEETDRGLGLLRAADELERSEGMLAGWKLEGAEQGTIKVSP